jgi:hypothetical protein
MIEGNATIAFGKFGNLEFPSIEQTDKARDEQEGLALTALLVVQRDVTDIDAGHESLLSADHFDLAQHPHILLSVKQRRRDETIAAALLT